MSKKKKETEKKTEKQEEQIAKEETSELEEEISEEDKKSQGEETSELEEEIEKTDNSINEVKFQEFIQQSSTDIPPVENFSPVLERTETPRQATDLEQDVSSSLTFGGDEKKDDVQTGYTSAGKSEYSAKPERDTENYDESRKINENLLMNQPAPINVETAGRDLHPQLREAAPVSLESWEVRKPKGTLEEKYVQPESIDMEKVGRERPEKIKEYKIR